MSDGRGKWARTPTPLVDRYWPKVDVRGDDECWPWIGGLSHGYGRIADEGLNAKTIPATHVALRFDGRPRPNPDVGALHSCDNPPCCNPKHLEWGDQLKNMADASTRGRIVVPSLAGDRHPRAKLTPDQVHVIREDGRASAIVAADYGIGFAHVCNIRTGKTWKSLPMRTTK